MPNPTFKIAVHVQSLWNNSSRQLFKIPEVSEILGIHASSVRRLIARGDLLANLKLRHVLVTRGSIERFINAGEDL